MLTHLRLKSLPKYWGEKCNMYRFTFYYIVISWVGMQAAWAGGGSGESFVLDHLINTVVLVGLIAFFAGKGIKKSLQDRADQISHEIQEAQKVYAQAEDVLARYQKMMDDFEAEREQMLASYRQQGEQEKAELIADGERLAQKLKEDAQRSIQNELGAMQRKIENDLLSKSLAKAESLLKAKVNATDHSRLTQEYLTQLEKRSPSA